ncbi:MAG: YceH family protein [Oceanipulchritudo sp.]
MELSLVEIRVLGALMEKARTTPELYPLTLNSLVHASNQKTSREPVTDYDEEEVLGALDQLREKHLVMRVDMAGSRTAKFRENASEAWQLNREEYALLTILMLRGPQTPGQLRQRAERLYPFATLQQVVECLNAMQHREDEPHCLARPLERRSGTKEIRYQQTVGPFGETIPGDIPATEPAAPVEPQPDRVSLLEERLCGLETRIAEMERIINEFTS